MPPHTHLVWYRSERSPEPWYGDIFDPDPADLPTPLRVDEVEGFLPHISRPDDHRPESVARFADNYRAHGHPQTVLATAVQSPAGHRVILDGCHRLAGTWLAGVPFAAALLTIKSGSEDPYPAGLKPLFGALAAG